MVNIDIYFQQPIVFLINKNDPVKYELTSLPGWKFINPLYYPLNLHTAIGIKENHIIGFFDADNIVVETSSLFFISPITNELNAPKLNDLFFPYIRELRERLRQVTLQENFSLIKSLSVTSNLFNLDFNKRFPEPSEKTVGIRQYILDTAITWDNLILADTLQEVAVYRTLFADAVHGYLNGDFRIALLYSAITMETFLSTELDRKYRALLLDDPQNILRVVRESRHSGDEKKKADKIYEGLTEANNFQKLLVEATHYLYGRTIIDDNEALHQRVLKVYRSRNRIAHTGMTSSADNSYGLNPEDSKKALEAVSEFLKWYGDTKISYRLHDWRTLQNDVKLKVALPYKHEMRDDLSQTRE